MSIPTQQKALIIPEQSAPFTLTRSFPVPEAGKDEVLVKIKAAALNPVDWMIQKSGIFVTHYPAVLGVDISGVIVQLGEGVKGRGMFKVGDKVMFEGTLGDCWQTGFREYTTEDVFTLSKIPSNITFDEASTIPLTLSTAYVGLYNVNPHGLDYEPLVRTGAQGKYARTPIVVIGGSSSVGQAAIQLARLSGFSPIITTSSLKHKSFLESLGATHVLDRNTSLSISHIQESITKVPIKAVYDTISTTDTQKQALDILAPGGQMVVILKPDTRIAEQAEKENKRVNWVVAAKKDGPEYADLLREFWPEVESLLRNGDIIPNRVEVLPGGLNGVVEGLERLENKVVSWVKLVVHPSETK